MSRDVTPQSSRGRRASVVGRALDRGRAALDPSAHVARPDDAFERAWRPQVKRRALFVLGVLVMWGVVIEGRLVQLQVFQHDKWTRLAHRQQQDLIATPARRGDIIDRRGRLLAYSVPGHGLLAFPSQLKAAGVAPAQAAIDVCGALGDCTAAERADLERKFDAGRIFYVRRARRVSPQQAARIDAADLPYLKLEPEQVRFYPGGELASHVLGWVNPDNEGMAGIEDVREDVVRGVDGRLFIQVYGDRGKRTHTRVEEPATAGATVELTIDSYLQYVAERELRAGIREERADGGTAIIVDPSTGEILALASAPDYNPNAYTRFTDDVRRNRAVTDVYEPGSTFKIVTAAAALEEGVLSPDDLIDCNPGVYRIGSRVIPEANGHNYGVLSFADVLVKSSNVGAVKAGLRIGAERLVRYAHRFGFGEATAPDFSGVSRGRVFGPSRMDDGAVASMSMGYQVSVTALQVAMAASAVANGGLLLEPHLVRGTTRDGRREVVEPKVVRRAITRETAATLTLIMEDVVSRGTATSAQPDRHTAAGKTGTASKIIDGRYAERENMVSFVGFVPSRRPAFTILVVIDNPRVGRFGGGVAAPIFKRIADAALRHAGVPPTIDPAPVLVVPAAPMPPPRRETRPAVVSVMTPVDGRTPMPDVRGLSLRDAVRALSRAGLTARPRGEGLVVTQSPEPGAIVQAGSWTVLELRREIPPSAPRSDGGDRR